MTTSLVTGGAGFIGSHLVQALIARGDRVIVLDDLSGGFVENVPGLAKLLTGDVCNQATVRLVFENFFEGKPPDYVYHLAAYAAEGLSPFIRRFNYINNVIGSVNIINACIKYNVKHLVFTSSIAVYGHGFDGHTTDPRNFAEWLIPNPIDPYGIAKYAVEMDLAAAREQFGLSYTIFRPHNVYGEHQNLGDRYRNVVGIFMNQIMRGEPLTIFGDGTQTRAFSYVGDIVGPIANCVNVPAANGEIFNVGGDQACTVLELAEAVERIASVAPTMRGFRFLPARKEARHATCDHSKAIELFGDDSSSTSISRLKTTPLTEGLAMMWAWARTVGPRKTKPFAEIELDKGLPDVWRRD